MDCVAPRDHDGPRLPLTPADCDLRDFPRMMIDIPRLRTSAFDATPDDAAWRAALNLWMSSWHGLPAASLDADDASLCKAAGLGRDLRSWMEIRVLALRGWVLCADGRLYHATVAEFALEAWLEKLGQRLSSGAGNARRWGGVFEPEPVKAAILASADLLRALNPASKALKKLSRSKVDGTADTIPPSSALDAAAIPSGSQEKGEGKEEVETDVSPSDASASAQGGGGKGERPEARDWSEVRDLYAEIVIRGRGSPMLARSAWMRLEADERRLLPAAIRRFAQARPWGSNGPPALQKFIADEVWREFASGPPILSVVWNGPAEVRAAVVAETSDAFARSWLDPSTWDPAARTPTLIALNVGAATRLRTLAALKGVAIQDPILPRKQA